MPNRSLSNRLWYCFLRRMCQLVGVLAFGVRHTGRSNIPADGGVLVVSNHQSHFDPPLVGMACTRRMNYLARDTLFGFGPLRWLIRSLDAIPIDREGLGLSGIKESLRRLKRGEMVLIFPEGTRTPNGKIGPFRPGFTSLAIRSKAAILPVAIEGAYAAWPREHRFPRLGMIRVHYGEPILPEEVEGYSERQLLAEVERRVRRCHARIRRRPALAGGRRSCANHSGEACCDG
ncbi:MAG: 1-acyl-sn-glycerol-3-phosphate acyltransferase [Pirellulales bacterium]|nr:1-acyl-sn-glycerol-3-phosphate acyltransferase [Pirellulales bacterium]